MDATPFPYRISRGPTRATRRENRRGLARKPNVPNGLRGGRPGAAASTSPKNPDAVFQGGMAFGQGAGGVESHGGKRTVWGTLKASGVWGSGDCIICHGVEPLRAATAGVVGADEGGDESGVPGVADGGNEVAVRFVVEGMGAWRCGRIGLSHTSRAGPVRPQVKACYLYFVRIQLSTNSTT